MADLEERIGEWRYELAESLGGSAEWLEELEGHLRDEVHALVQAGQPLEQAFAAAVARVGDAPALAAEFARGTPPTPWWPVRVTVIASIALAGLLVGLVVASGRFGGGLGLLLAAHVTAVTLGYCLKLLIGVLATCYVLVRPFGRPDPRQVQGLVRTTYLMTAAALVLTLLGILVGGFWLHQSLGRFWGWGPKETGGALMILWDVAVFAVFSRRLFGAHALLLLGLAGNAVAALALLGPILLDTGLHDFGSSPLAVPLVLFLLAQVALAFLGLVPADCLGRRKTVRMGRG